MSKRFRKLRHGIGYIFFSAIVFAVKITPRFLGVHFFGFLGFSFGFLFKKERGITQKNLKKAFENYSQKQINRITNGVFVNAAKSFFDWIKLPQYPPKKFFKIVRLHDENLIKEILSNNSGSVILSAHLSAFELQTQIAAMLGFDAISVGSRLFDQRIDKVFAALRRRNGVKYYDRSGGMKFVLKNLKKGGNFGVLIDQDATNEGVFVNFFKEEAFTPYIPVRIAIRHKIPLSQWFLIREKGEKYVLYAQKIDVVETENEIETCILNLQKYNENLEEFIRKYPEQWVWMHERWRRKAKDFPPQLSISYYKKEEK
jgi:KDO2-lipid IV(A) lauroyltransferase